MSIVSPFKAFRYQKNLVNLAESISPPYDVIGVKDAEPLHAVASNAIHVEYPKGVYDGENLYLKAKNTWDHWKSESIVKQDDVSAIYICCQDIPFEGKIYRRTGMFLEVQLEDPKTGSILRHESTMESHKKDRLDLIRNVQINTSPIFGLFRGMEQISDDISQYITREPDDVFEDMFKISFRGWSCTDPDLIQKIQNCIAKSSIMIADGHHRYETAWNYYQEVKRTSTDSILLDKSSCTLFYLSSLHDEGILMFPTHRISKRSHQLSLQEILHRIQDSPIFDYAEVSLNEEMDFKNSNCFFLVSTNKKYKITRKKSVNRLIIADIHEFILFNSRKEDYIYSHVFQKTLDIMHEENTWCVLVPNILLDDMYEMSRDRSLMPQKSTYFYPKVASGIVFRSLVN